MNYYTNFMMYRSHLMNYCVDNFGYIVPISARSSAYPLKIGFYDNFGYFGEGLDWGY